MSDSFSANDLQYDHGNPAAEPGSGSNQRKYGLPLLRGFNTYLRKNYRMGDAALEFFTVHMAADKEHTAQSTELIARMTKTDILQRSTRGISSSVTTPQ